MGNISLVIKVSKAEWNGKCALCGGRTHRCGGADDSWIGPELFVEGTWNEVCCNCGCKEAPELADVLLGVQICFDESAYAHTTG